MQKPQSLKVQLNLPCVGKIEGTWEVDENDKKAAWEMYVELITRISVAKLRPEEGLLREALSSLYTLFETTRNILKNYGPSIAQPKGNGKLSFGYLAVTILNVVLRPVLAKWHPLLLDYENKRHDSTTSTLEREKQWDKYEELRQVLNETRESLIEYANLLSDVAGVPSLILDNNEMNMEKSI